MAAILRNGIGKLCSCCGRSHLYYITFRSSSNVSTTNQNRSILPGISRILLIRHGETLGNVDERAYEKTADWQIPLTDRGREQARIAGKKVASHIMPSNSNKKDGNIFFYVSPYLRTRQSLREILSEIPKEKVLGIREDPRLSEQQFGNFESHHTMMDNKATRMAYGRFYYRFPGGGESGFDVYNRISGFIGTLKRDSVEYCDTDEEDYSSTICIVTHGLTLELFLMRWFQYSVHEFERSYTTKNAAVICLERDPEGRFELSAADQVMMNFPSYHEQERFRFIHDYSLLERVLGEGKV